MKVAVAKRPVEQFETQVPLPDWQLEPDEEAWGLDYVRVRRRWSTPTAIRSACSRASRSTRWPRSRGRGDGQVDQQWLDEVLRPQSREPPPQPSPSRRRSRRRRASNASDPPADPLQPRP